MTAGACWRAARSTSGTSTGGAGDRPARRRRSLVIAGVVARLRAAEAARRRPQPEAPPSSRRSRRSRKRRRSTGRSSGSTRRAPATCRRRGSSRPSASSGATPSGRCSSSRRSTPAASSTSSTTAATPSRSTPTPARCSGNGGSAASTPPRRPTTSTASTSSTSSPATSSSSTPRPARSIWKRSLPGRAESSPVVIGRTVYFGCEDGNLYALSTDQRQRALGDPARRPDQVGARLLRRHPLRRRLRRLHERGRRQDRQARSGRAARSGQGFGASGEFYSTPAVAFGRVYAGNNDDRVYSFDIKRRRPRLELLDRRLRLLRARPSPTPAHSPPTVYIGSFDGNVYALDAKDGSLRWSRSAGGQVVGSLSAVGDIVYVAEFTNNTTSGFMMKSGRRVFHYPTRHLHAGDLRRPPHLPDRLLEHHRAAALQVQTRRRPGDRRARSQSRSRVQDANGTSLTQGEKLIAAGTRRELSRGGEPARRWRRRRRVARARRRGRPGGGARR